MGFKEPSFLDRQSAAQNARKSILEKFKAKPGPDDPAVLKRAAERQAQVAERMGTQAPAVARLERALASGKHSPSVATIRKYLAACGKQLVVDTCPM